MINDEYFIPCLMCGRDDAIAPKYREPFKSFGVCPNCNNNISTRNASNYCHVCGQRIDWKVDAE